MDMNDASKLKCANLRKEVVHKGKWISTNLIHYRDGEGKQRQWESVGRTTKLDFDTSDAVAVVAILKRALHHDCFVMVKQYRPPVGCHTLEFPAGLIDSKDGCAKTAALRELYEETGYRGNVKGKVGDTQTCLDPGILETTVNFVCVEIDGDCKDNFHHAQHLDEGEHVEVVLYPVRDFTPAKLSKWAAASGDKTLIDSRVLAYALGFEMAISVNDKKHSLHGLLDDPPNEVLPNT